MARTPLQVSSLKHEVVKQSLIDFLRASGKFDDFDFEGSAINTQIDLLVRNSQYDAFLANMLASESFIQSAQMRQNVVSHAQKLSYTPKSTTATRLICDIEVIPANTDNVSTSIVMETGTQFITTINGITYTFVNIEPYTLSYSQTTQTFTARNVVLYQGQLIQNVFSYVSETSVEIPNSNIDTSTLQVITDEATSDVDYKVYEKAETIKQLSEQNNVFFVSENTRGLYEVSFGRNILGSEPDTGTEITCTYIATEDDHGNGIKTLNSASTIGGYANINVTVTTRGYGGSDKEDIERIRYVAPKAYTAQDRALTADDYALLTKSQFPFVKSAISWGGEDSTPPQYGSVFVSIITDNNVLITRMIEQKIISYLKSKNVGSIVPVVVNPKTTYIDLGIGFTYNNAETSDYSNDVAVKIQNECKNYSDTSLVDFGKYFNAAQLIDNLMSIAGVDTVEFDTSMYQIITKQIHPDYEYEVNYNNPVENGSVTATGFITDITRTNHKMFDENGKLYVENYNDSNQRNVVEVGAVDYQTGVLTFTMSMLQDEDEVKVYAKPQKDNIYVVQNNIVSIDDVTTNLITTSS